MAKKTKNKRVNEVKITNNHDEQEYDGTARLVTLPFLHDGYDWIQLDPPDIYNEVNHVGDPKELPHNLCHHSNAVTEADARNYCLFLNERPDPAAIMNYKSLIQSFRKNYQDYIYEIIFKFWFDIANKLEFNSSGEEIRDTKQLNMSIARFQSIDDCRKILIMMYIVFDFVLDYQAEITRMVEKKFHILVLQPPTTLQRRTLDFMTKLITQQLTNIRKGFNKELVKLIGIKCTITKGKQTEEQTSRVKQWTYPWMITGKFVSLIVRHLYITYYHPTNNLTLLNSGMVFTLYALVTTNANMVILTSHMVI